MFPRVSHLFGDFRGFFSVVEIFIEVIEIYQGL